MQTFFRNKISDNQFIASTPDGAVHVLLKVYLIVNTRNRFILIIDYYLVIDKFAIVD